MDNVYGEMPKKARSVLDRVDFVEVGGLMS
jgi:hypothetical protein